MRTSLFFSSESNCFARWTTTFVSSWPLSALEMDNSNAGMALNVRSSSHAFFSRFLFSRRCVTAASNMPWWPSWTGLNDPLSTTFAAEHPIVSSLPLCIEYTLRSGMYLDSSSLLLLLLLLLLLSFPTSSHLSNKDFFFFFFLSFDISNQGAAYSKNSNSSSLNVNASSRNSFQDALFSSSVPLKRPSASSSSSSSSSPIVHLSLSPTTALTRHSLATRSSSSRDLPLSLSSVTFLVVTPNFDQTLTKHLCSPFFGRLDTNAHVAPTPRTRFALATSSFVVVVVFLLA